MKKLTALAVSLTMILGLAACGGGTTPATTTPPATTPPAASTPVAPAGGLDALDPVELEMADATALGAAGNLLGNAIVKNAEALSGGKMTVVYYANSEMGGDADILQQVQNKSLDITILQTAPSATFVSDVAVFDLPMVFAKYDGATIDKVLNGSGDFRTTLEGSFEEAGFKLMGFLQNATFRLTTSKIPLNTLEDFSGLIIRTMENANHQAFWTAIGAAPTPMAWGEVYVALSQGTIHAQENAADTCASSNFHEVQKYLNLTNHILYLNQVLMNNESFNDLDPAYQDILVEAINMSIAEIAPQLGAVDSDNKDKLKAGGMEIIDYTPDFYDNILNMDGVKALYTQIDNSVNGLGTMLQNELEAAG